MKNSRKRPFLQEITVTRYPFRKWFSSPMRLIYKGTDYQVDSRVMAQQIRNAANEMGFNVSTKSQTYAIALVVWDRVPGKKGK